MLFYWQEAYKKQVNSWQHNNMFLKQVGPTKHPIFAKILILDRKKNIRDVYDLGLLKIA